ncbi:telomere repeat-binding protein 5 isoform X1 [Rhodamnia argentea]|uniref:Telomere repeat-binding protein 5 isoform X1 n=1 Tax=Rhodamnia argentea TaxID=178133 RepID=A0A8B8PTG9_9MYRT|nr:telomere repeat-binding protein 5 isoform X1 [Rhodamnia argentea]XP_030537548.1 telomere repeat-binding protein 5 isoform X1 [Rhodamnia argentea]XP_048137266.1 telomere repeat-binding protein 5 isoform X1 [Rhodamnia argentea]
MVLNRRLEYGFNGYQVPAMPRGTRSARRRNSIKKNVEDSKMHAFDLLATLAGKLLVGNSSSSSSSNSSTKKDQFPVTDSTSIEERRQNQFTTQLELQACDQASCGRSMLDPQLVSQKHHDPKLSPEDTQHPVMGSTDSERLGTDELRIDKRNDETSRNAVVEPLTSTDSKLEDDTQNEIKVEQLHSDKAPNDNGAVMYSFRDPVVWDAKPLMQISLESGAAASFPANKDRIAHDSLSPARNVEVVSRDDDEKSSGCTHPVPTKKSFRPVPHIGDRRIRKVLASRHWKVALRSKNEFPRTGVNFKADYKDKSSYYKRQRSQRNYPFKKRKFFDIDFESYSDKEISSNAAVYPSENHTDGDVSAKRPSPPASGQHLSYQSTDSHVKLRIESFTVPELFIEISETATIGSLKRAVMEAVSGVLGGELRVGVLLQGKKVGDDSKTLLQTGISQDNQLNSLGFALEPDPSHTSASPKVSSLFPCDVPQPLIRYPIGPNDSQKRIHDTLPEHEDMNIPIVAENDCDMATSPVGVLKKGTTQSKALVPVSSMNVEALAVVPVHRKSKRSEFAQRRIRRPFSVSEVEALVQAVEKLGTGRWRDVKLRAFDSAKHRTYVDLKDKWKTLVHTARISPQQRRGEPVPQELLDRVLTAHAYWSQHQAKQQLKHI